MRATALLLAVFQLIAVEAILKYIPHGFDINKAALLFRSDEKRQLMSPIRLKSFGKSLRKALTPLHTFKCKVSRVHYTGEYAVQIPSVTINRRGEMIRTYHTVWYPASGELPDCRYSELDRDMKLYGGNKFHGPSVERLFQGQAIDSLPTCHTFSLAEYCNENKDDIVDAIVRPSNVVRKIFYERLYLAEKRRADVDLSRRVWGKTTRITNVQYDVSEAVLSQFMLPVFVLMDMLSADYDSARFLSGLLPPTAFNSSNGSTSPLLVVGPRDISVVKSVCLGAFASVLHQYVLSTTGAFTHWYTAFVALVGLLARFWKTVVVFRNGVYRRRQGTLDRSESPSEEDLRLISATTREVM